MNKFLDALKYNVNEITHKAKKGLLIGSLSLLAASSVVGCSKSSPDTTTHTNSESTQDNTNKDKLNKAFEQLNSDADKLAEELEVLSPSSELSDDDSVKLTNFLLKYVFTKTSENYGGDIPATSIIPNMVNGKLDATFNLSEEDHVYYFNTLEKYKNQQNLDSQATEFYNSFPDYADTKDALSYIYTVKADLSKQNPDLISELSYDDMLNLIKSSYISAYNNINSDDQFLNASNSTLSVNLINEYEDKYDISWHYRTDNDEFIPLNDIEHSDGTSLADDYEDVCIKYYLNDSNSSMLDSLEEANEKNDVTTKQIISQLIDINMEKAKEEATNQTDISSESSEIDR